MSSKFAAGQIYRIGPRYTMDGYVNDNGTGDVVRLIRPSANDWLCTTDVNGTSTDWEWSYHTSRLENSTLLGTVATPEAGK